ncbi:MAG TPA: hypothetical protein VLU73_15740 [Methylococcaceae bacterium]|nr:hypothetical protein [Methylococcaceae bacterium]
MARMKFLCDEERCIECNACVTACKNDHEVPWGVPPPGHYPGQRRAGRKDHLGRLYALYRRTVSGGVPGGLLLHHRRRGGAARQGSVHRLRILFYACPFGAPQYPQKDAFGARGKMDKCTFCAGGPEEDHSEEEFREYGCNHLAEGKLPLCAEMCSTKALLAGDADLVSNLFRERVVRRAGNEPVDGLVTKPQGKPWGWDTAYKE